MHLALGASFLVTAEFTDTTAATGDEPVIPAPESTEVTQSDAANQSADAAEESVSAFLEGKEGAEGGKEADEEPPEVKEAREAAAAAEREKVNREEKARIAQENRDAENRKAKADADKAFEDNYKARMEQAGPKLEARLVELGIDATLAKAIANEQAQLLNSHHADGKKLHEPNARSEAAAFYSKALNEAIQSSLGDKADQFFGSESDPKGYASIDDALKTYRELVTDGLSTPAQVEAAKKVSLLSYYRDLFEKDDGKKARDILAGRRSGQVVNGTAAGGSYSSEFELNVAFNNGDVSRETYATEYKRLTGRDP